MCNSSLKDTFLNTILQLLENITIRKISSILTTISTSIRLLSTFLTWLIINLPTTLLVNGSPT